MNQDHGRTPQRKIGSGFGKESTAAEVVAGIDLGGKTAIVTGGYSGLGLETVRALASAGARVLVGARRPDHARQVLEAAGIAASEWSPTAASTAGGSVGVSALDLADLASVKDFADSFLSPGSKNPARAWTSWSTTPRSWPAPSNGWAPAGSRSSPPTIWATLR